MGCTRRVSTLMVLGSGTPRKKDKVMGRAEMTTTSDTQPQGDAKTQASDIRPGELHEESLLWTHDSSGEGLTVEQAFLRKGASDGKVGLAQQSQAFFKSK